MRRKNKFCNQLLSMILSLALVFGSVNVPGLTANAEEQTEVTVETETSVEADEVNDTLSTDVQQSSTAEETRNTSDETTAADNAVDDESAKVEEETFTQAASVEEETVEVQEAVETESTTSSVEDEVEVQAATINEYGITCTVDNSYVHIITGGGKKHRIYIHKKDASRGEAYKINNTDLHAGVDIHTVLGEKGDYVLDIDVYNTSDTNTVIANAIHEFKIENLKPGQPRDFIPHAGPGSITVAFNSNDQNMYKDHMSIIKYYIKLGELTVFDDVKHGGKITGIKPGKYQVKLISVNQYGESVSERTIDVTQAPEDGEIIYTEDNVKEDVSNQPPAKPSGFTAGYDKENKTVNMSWSAQAGIGTIPTDYTINIKDKDGKVVKTFADTSYGTTQKSVSVADLQAGDYTVELIAKNDKGNSEAATAVFTIAGPDIKTPSGLKAEYNQTDDTIDLSWTQSGETPSEFEIKVGNTVIEDLEVVYDNNGNATAKIPNTFKSGDTTITVTPKAEGVEVEGAEVAFKVPALEAPVISEGDVKYNPKDDTIDVTWDLKDGAAAEDSYVIKVDGETVTKVKEVENADGSVTVKIPNDYDSGSHEITVELKRGTETQTTTVNTTIPELKKVDTFSAAYNDKTNKIDVSWTEQSDIIPDYYLFYVDADVEAIKAGSVESVAKINGGNTDGAGKVNASIDNNYSAGEHEIYIVAVKEGADGNAVTEPVKQTVTMKFLNFDKLDEYGNIDKYEGSENGWTDASGNGGDAEYTTNGNEIIIDIADIGQYSPDNNGADDAWQVHIKALENLLLKGKEYTISFDIESDIDKKAIFQIEDTATDKMIDGTQAKNLDLKADTPQNVSVNVNTTTFTDDIYANLVFALGYQEGDSQENAKAQIKISNLQISYVENGKTFYGSGADAPVDEDTLDRKKEELDKLYDDLKKKYPDSDKSSYTEESWNNLQDAFEKAKEVIDSGDDALLGDVNGAITNLKNADRDIKIRPTTVVVSEHKGIAETDKDIVLSYTTDNKEFELDGNFKVLVDGVEVDASKVEIDDTKKTVTISKDVIGTEGTHTVEFKVTDEAKEEYGDCDITPVYQTVYKPGEWSSFWSDEFDKTGLDTTKWDYQTGSGEADGEKQTYTMSSDNLKVDNGKLTITAKKKDDGSYTSAMISTVDENTGKALKIGKYGRIEAKMKLPAAAGAWPSFWMLPYDSKYGDWAASGEIDIMEARGRIPSEVNGAIHYGGEAPNDKYSAVSKAFENGTDFTEYHIYAVEWNPTKITWLVDGQEYASISNWHSIAGEEGNWPYPAPFDEEFYLLLNLAVGGDFDPAITSEEDIKISESGVSMEVDYVRWYRKDDSVYNNADLTEPTVEKDASDKAKEILNSADSEGNFLKDSKFENFAAKDDKSPITNSNELSPITGEWIPLVFDETEGKAEFATETVDGKNYLKVDVKDVGTESYSSQMIQYFPLVKGYSYVVEYKAYASTENGKSDILMKIGGDAEESWSVYSSIYNDDLTTTPKTYTHVFTMTEPTDEKARFEFNLASSEGIVYVTDVSVKLLPESVNPESMGEDLPKEPLDDGNHIYNGDFNMGSDGLLYWHWTPEDQKDVVKVVTDENGERVAKVTVPDAAKPTELTQKGINLLQDEDYKLTFKVDSEKAQKVKVVFTNSDGTTTYSEAEITVPAGASEQTHTFRMPQNVTDENATFKLIFEDEATVDKIKLTRESNNNIKFEDIEKWPIYNGDFFNGLDGWVVWHEANSWQSAIVNTEKQLETQIKVEKDAKPHNIGIKTKKDITLTKDIKYKVKFDYTLPESKTYTLKIAGLEQEITLKKGTHTYESEAFRGTGNTKFELWFGNTPSDIYTLKLDNVVVYVDPEHTAIEPGYAQPVSLATKEIYRTNNDVVILFSENADWEKEAAVKKFWLNDKEVQASIDYDKNEITLSKDNFTAVGAYKLVVQAEGFCDTKPLSFEVIDGTNYIPDGDFSGYPDNEYQKNEQPALGEWWLYCDNDSDGTLAVENGVVRVEHNYHGGDDYSMQLIRGGVTIPEEGDYILSFDAWKNADGTRPISVQLQTTDYTTVGGSHVVALGDEAQNYKIILEDVPAIEDLDLKIFLGKLQHNGLWADNEDTYDVFFDNVILEKYSPENHSKYLPAELSVAAGAMYENDALDVKYEFVTDEWKASAKNVYVNNEVIDSKYVTYSADGFTISGDLFAHENRYFVYVIADGYASTNTVYKNVIKDNGNLIINGDLNSYDGWYVENLPDAEYGGLSYGVIEDGKFNMDYYSGYANGYYDSPANTLPAWVEWATVLGNNNIQVPDTSKEYVLKFTASTDLEGGRDIKIEGTGFESEYSKAITQKIEAGEAKVYTVKIPEEAMNVVEGVQGAMWLKFLLGPIGEELQIDPDSATVDGVQNANNIVPHNLTIDNIYFGLAEDYLDKIKDDLKDLVDEYEDLKQNDYTDDSWKEFQDTIQDAKDVLDNPNSTEKDVENAIDKLDKAYRNLKVVIGLWARDIPDQIYTGKAIKPVVEAYNNIEHFGDDGSYSIEERQLVLKKDYTVKYKYNKNVTDGAVAIVKGKGNYTKPAEVKFRILPKNLDNSDVTVDNGLQKVTVSDVYAVIDKKTGEVKKLPKVTVKYGKIKLKENKDYIIRWPDKYDRDENGIIPKSYEVTIEAVENGNYTGKTTFQYDVVDTNALLMSKAKIKLDVKTVEYNPDFPEQTYQPVVTEVKIGKTVLDKRLYTVEYPEAQIGKVKLTVTGLNNDVTPKVYGSKTVTYTIKGTPLNKKNITVSGKGIGTTDVYTYTGEEIFVENLVLQDNNRKTADGKNYQLVEDIDYTVAYAKNVKAGTAKITFNGIGAYSGKLSANFKIAKKDISSHNNEKSDITFSYKNGTAEAVYTKKGAMPEIIVMHGDTELTVKKDYTVAYKDNKAVTNGQKTAKVIVKGKGNYTGTFEEYFSVKSPEPNVVETSDNNNNLVKAVYAVATDIVVPNSVDKLKKQVKVKVYEASTGKKLSAGKDYSKDFKFTVVDKSGAIVSETVDSAHLKADTIIGVEITLSGNYGGAKEKTIYTTFRLYDKQYKASKIFKVTLPKDMIYTGLPITLGDQLIVMNKNTNEKLKLGVDYTVEYVNNVKKGTAKVIITGCGNKYGGSKTVKFKIKAKPIEWSNKTVLTQGVAQMLSDIVENSIIVQ